jgi:hypothetical protein
VRLRTLFKLGVLVLAGIGAKSLYDKYLAGSTPAAPLFPQGPIDLRADEYIAVQVDPLTAYTPPPMAASPDL